MILKELSYFIICRIIFLTACQTSTYYSHTMTQHEQTLVEFLASQRNLPTDRQIAVQTLKQMLYCGLLVIVACIVKGLIG